MAKPATALKQRTIDLLNQRGVNLEDIADLVIFLQKNFIKDLNPELALDSVQTVLSKREVQNAIITGIQLDIAAENHTLLEPLQTIVERDEGLYGVDETMALSIVDIYGSIGFTNYGYIDRVKPGILAKLNAHEPGIIHTFLDDLVGAIAAAAAARLAHDDQGEQDTPFK
ncbi:phosphatidylglycerophosphatase A [Levilactobacillus brevis]|uniref:phosphatidylglycerophosphatase A family protein n=1 Tax=Levilactobacillus brevis TaxID=1580 RepID=UPI001C1F0166|nr:phosphatidylglycerophosphatase A [Levilactobacillus brevis]MBU7538924.1 phosphatidylglycerophosphatase A [Levilactobacillus brevis]MBU7559946.1 phosphatidylglycerophosphatase A [Levilactobacillus brevis]MBU7565097.1 phosphatidylglycerophosphatase A [Levilactobacillus brevis]MCE6011513.1 phosphatidylglycerophosphatase A [Levilactobacillus brevis]MCE6013209.1 phosphatidylglycerophosphatase A [Levilactobacillus brevis]